MQEDIKYFMLTVNLHQEDKEVVAANVYKDVKSLKEAHSKFKDKVETHCYVLTPVEADEDIVLAEVKGKLVACMGAKRPINADEKGFIKCKMQEIILK